MSKVYDESGGGSVIVQENNALILPSSYANMEEPELELEEEMDEMMERIRIKAAENGIWFNPDMSKIYPGMVLNYKKLTELLGVPYYSGGNSKSKQLDLLKCYMDYDKEGTKYSVREVYPKPRPVLPITFSKNSKYVEDVMNVLSLYIFSAGAGTVFLSFNDFAFVLGMINRKFLDYDKKKKEYAKEHNLELSEVKDFYMHTKSFYKKTIENALKSMKNRCLINYHSSFIIKDKSKEWMIREARDDEIIDLIAMQRAVLTQMGIDNISELYYKPNGYKEYYKAVEEIAKSRHPTWEFFWPVMKILTPYQIMAQQADEIIGNAAKTKLNEDTFIYIYNQAQSLYLKGTYDTELLNHQREVIEDLISIDGQNVMAAVADSII